MVGKGHALPCKVVFQYMHFGRYVKGKLKICKSGMRISVLLSPIRYHLTRCSFYSPRPPNQWYPIFCHTFNFRYIAYPDIIMQ